MISLGMNNATKGDELYEVKTLNFGFGSVTFYRQKSFSALFFADLIGLVDVLYAKGTAVAI